jgi:four helix bundle protein
MDRSRVSDLQVFQRAYAVSLEVHKASLGFPQIEQYAMADQIRRASKSICVNLAEGYAKRVASQIDFKRFLVIALGSSDEMQIWSRYCLDLGYIDEAAASRWVREYEAISRMLQSLIRKVAQGVADS